MSSAHARRLHFEEGTSWEGAKVLGATLIARDVVAHLPSFTRAVFGTDDGFNENLEVVWREPYLGDRRRIPLATVSKRYALLQHTELVDQLVNALEITIEGSSSVTDTHIRISEYGERMECAFQLSGHSYDPGDGFPISLRLFLRNSVDGSCAFEIFLRWYRQIFSNGLAVLTRADSLRAIHHLDRMSAEEFHKFLRQRIPAATAEAALYKA